MFKTIEDKSLSSQDVEVNFWDSKNNHLLKWDTTLPLDKCDLDKAVANTGMTIKGDVIYYKVTQLNKKISQSSFTSSINIYFHLRLLDTTVANIVKSLEETAFYNHFKYDGAALALIYQFKEHKGRYYCSNDIDFLKDAVMSLESTIPSSAEYENIVSDLIFLVETEYQNRYGLDENDWEKIGA